MTLRKKAVALLAAAAVLTSAGAAYAQSDNNATVTTGIQSITPITEVFTYGQRVSAVAVEYSANVDPASIDLKSFTVADTVYNFRFNPIDDLSKMADRTITNVYTNSRAHTRSNKQSVTGRYVIVELDSADAGGWTVIVSKCPTFLCTVKVNPELPTTLAQRKPVKALGSGGAVLAPGTPNRVRSMTNAPVNLLVDEFTYDAYLSGGMALPYHYHLPANYNPAKKYPLVVVLPGHGMGWDGVNTGVQIAADIPAVAWLQRKWTGSDEDVIVLAPQNQRVGAVAEADLLAKMIDQFIAAHSVDTTRVYATTVSYGSQLAWETFAKRPNLWAAGLITGGFQVSATQAGAIADAEIPVYITHGVNDHLLNISLARNSRAALTAAYTEDGKTEQEIASLLKYTEYGNDAFSIPDYHAAYGPTYEDRSILQWLLSQRKGATS
ncbi:hypothetical protein [Micromonospora sp. NBC_01813]|uniref:hypothetical protein n=1 Tax=Micromonospora sp. NBC_01813 TaxID=2975988 RepID=UPI002DD97442|nr:hypothetical protein [Micromonospora sp. NBC_01813]WSA08028.1 hypothetical protein OG958_28070 [Micromonospora sp. NBC_01813]